MAKTLIICITLFLSSSAFVFFTGTKPKIPKEYAYIPAGTFWNEDGNSAKRITLLGYYMSIYEVTNKMYRDFLHEVTPHLSSAEVEKLQVDSSRWDIVPIDGGLYRPNYFMHPAYNNYPVVNIYYEGALKYCEWLQQKIQKDNPRFFIRVKLPSIVEWSNAAKGRNSNAVYPWIGHYLRAKNGKFLCNFRFIDETAIVRNRETGKPEISNGLGNQLYSFPTVHVSAYYPNDFNLYNMSGNAAEMTDSLGICMGGSWYDFGGEVKVNSKATYEMPSPMVGFRPIIIVSEISKN